MLRKSLPEYWHQARSLIREKGLRRYLAGEGRDFVDRLSAQWRERSVVRAFHRLYYHSAYDTPPRTWGATSWLGVPVLKCPLDLFVYQEILSETRPQVIVETGTALGGSALFLASLCELLGQGEVITVDIVDQCQARHPRLTTFVGSSTDPQVVERITASVAGRSAMVILDSDHSKAHVLRELANYSELVPVGHYLIVEDTNINGHPVGWQYGPGPAEAVAEFLHHRDDFEVDRRREKHLLTHNPGGYLRRVRDHPSHTNTPPNP